MLHRRYLLALTLITTLGVTGCSESHAEDDAAITFDANLPLPDAGPPPTMVGIACTVDADCSTGTCLIEFPDGYCTQECTDAADCPGAACVMVDREGNAVCLQTCDPAAAASTCRVGYGCSLDGVCIPGCDTDASCPTGSSCEPDAGFSGEGACYGDSGLGQPCLSSDDCAGDARCNSEERWGFPGGACVGRGCDVAGNSSCPGDSQCIEFGFGGGACLDGCTVDEDCRDAYSCQPAEGFPDRRVCLPAFDPATLGTACSAGRGGCVGGECLAEATYGWPDSYCVAVGCTAGLVPSDCPGDGVCWGVEEGICLDACTTVDDCRPGYECSPSDPTNPASPTACRPGCADATVCGNEGFVCNIGTGLCTEPFVPSSLGTACIEDPTICVGGRCLSEAERGWPAGTCSYPGCALASGGAGGAACPAMSACVDDETGDPTLGVCISTCSVASPTCRIGYACEALVEGTDDGVCRPACTTGICSVTLTCNVTSGLCEGG